MRMETANSFDGRRKVTKSERNEACAVRPQPQLTKIFFTKRAATEERKMEQTSCQRTGLG